MNWTEWIGLQPNAAHDRLISEVLTAHKQAALTNDNVSSASLKLAGMVKTPFSQSVASALITLGGPVHGPTKSARELIYGWTREELVEALSDRVIIPGWGNAFFKDKLDPAWVGVNSMLLNEYEEHHKLLEVISRIVTETTGKQLWPNAAAFTAVTAQIIGLPLGLEILLLILGRLPAWAVQYSQC